MKNLLSAGILMEAVALEAMAVVALVDDERSIGFSDDEMIIC